MISSGSWSCSKACLCPTMHRFRTSDQLSATHVKPWLAHQCAALDDLVQQDDEEGGAVDGRAEGEDADVRAGVGLVSRQTKQCDVCEEARNNLQSNIRLKTGIHHCYILHCDVAEWPSEQTDKAMWCLCEELWCKQQPRSGLNAHGDPGSIPTRGHFPYPIPNSSLISFTILSD